MKSRKHIDPWRTTRDGRQICSQTPAGRKEYRNRTLQMRTRQGCLCGLCGRWMQEEDTTFDHEIPRGAGGANTDDRIEVDGKRKNAAVHWSCNSDKGSRRIPYILQ